MVVEKEPPKEQDSRFVVRAVIPQRPLPGRTSITSSDGALASSPQLKRVSTQNVKQRAGLQKVRAQSDGASSDAGSQKAGSSVTRVSEFDTNRARELHDAKHAP